MIPSVRKRKRKDTEIAVTNLVDIIFVLLIFFILNSTFTKQSGIDINKPSAQSASQLDKSSLQVTVTKSGAIHLNDRQVDLNMLQTILQREMARSPEKPMVILADRNSDMGVVVDIMDEANMAGVRNVSVGARIQ